MRLKFYFLLASPLIVVTATGSDAYAGLYQVFGSKKNAASVQKAHDEFRHAATSGSHDAAQIRAAAAKVHNRIARRAPDVDVGHALKEHAKTVVKLQNSGNHPAIAKEEEAKLAQHEKAFQNGKRAGLSDDQSHNVEAVKAGELQHEKKVKELIGATKVKVDAQRAAEKSSQERLNGLQKRLGSLKY
jgi:hypothetical protein